MEPTVTLARRFWAAIEPIHAVVYFAPGPLEAARKTGLRGFWMSYFAGRVAPLGALPAPAVEAMTYGFAPGIVARAIPDAWRFASPEAVLEARLASAPEALRHHVDPALLASAAELADLLWEGIAGCRFDGRPLAAAWAGVPRPGDAVHDHANRLIGHGSAQFLKRRSGLLDDRFDPAELRRNRLTGRDLNQGRWLRCGKPPRQHRMLAILIIEREPCRR